MTWRNSSSDIRANSFTARRQGRQRSSALLTTSSRSTWRGLLPLPSAQLHLAIIPTDDLAPRQGDELGDAQAAAVGNLHQRTVAGTACRTHEQADLNLACPAITPRRAAAGGSNGRPVLPSG
jgi:hypothetical protein